MKRAALVLAGLILLPAAGPVQAKGGFFPTYHPKPCDGADCRGDDARSGLPCEGLLCTFTSAKSLQKPVTASEAAEMQAKAAAASTAAEATPTPSPSPEPRKKRKGAGSRAKDAARPAADTKLADDQSR